MKGFPDKSLPSTRRAGAGYRSRDLVQGLAKKGVRHLLSLGEVDSHRIHEKRVGQLYLDHTVEVDRGTMPVVRSNPAQSSFYRKLLAYHETWRSGLHVCAS